ncbi:zinc finger protein [Herbihabitans rhizosphaerae]|uniref:Zinc finger protein n=1 Tax=Herbihabitans rhizosphaerae TaxID=1872711 RepID=A0A4Q7L698_9PSEU|nr:zinc finger protein [Herbihabitans rhizosphaerae]RZS45208.1 zinc finger protein [Herbihabitans rhizosphaerae]
MQAHERKFRWQNAGGRRHATRRKPHELPPRPGEQVTVLCGQTITLIDDDFPELQRNQLIHPTCRECNRLWCADEGIPLPAALSKPDRAR